MAAAARASAATKTFPNMADCGICQRVPGKGLKKKGSRRAQALNSAITGRRGKRMNTYDKEDGDEKIEEEEGEEEKRRAGAAEKRPARIGAGCPVC